MIGHGQKLECFEVRRLEIIPYFANLKMNKIRFYSSLYCPFTKQQRNATVYKASRMHACITLDFQTTVLSIYFYYYFLLDVQ